MDLCWFMIEMDGCTSSFFTMGCDYGFGSWSIIGYMDWLVRFGLPALMFLSYIYLSMSI